MKWACPHCQTSLTTPTPPVAPLASGPQPGWAYARCLGCQEFAEVELSTGRAVAFSHLRRQITPPPFKHAGAPAPVPVQVTSPLKPPAPPSFDEIIRAQIEAAPPLSAPALRLPSRKVATALTYGGSLAIAAGVTLHLTASSLAPHLGRRERAVTSAATSHVPTSLERAHAAAHRIQTLPQKTLAAPTAVLAQVTRLAPVAELRHPGAGPELQDTLRSAAMAPRRPRPDDIQLYLQARPSTRSMELRTGPSTEFALMGFADLEERYPVLEVKDRWFKIQLEETPGLTAWVPYERIELFSQDKPDTREGKL